MISNDTLKLDWDFKLSLMTDLVRVRHSIYTCIVFSASILLIGSDFKKKKEKGARKIGKGLKGAGSKGES